MRVLQPLLRRCSRFGPRNAANLTQTSRCVTPALLLCSTQTRNQHNDHGPHKEYFQIPGKEPKPDLTPYIREIRPAESSPSPQTSTSLSRQNQASQGQQSTGQSSRGWQSIPRFLRSALWCAVFLNLGVVAGRALITWEYLSPPFEPGSPEEQELIEEILETLEIHPMVESLRENEWIEVDAFTPDLQHGLKGKNLVHQVLGGHNTQGVFLKVFHHPTQEFTMLVFFLGFGVEGWPDMIHGGVISTLMQEGLSKHIGYYYPGYYTTPQNSTKVDFKKPCKPGEIYGLLVAPSGRKAATSGNVHLTELQMTTLLVQLASAPLVSSDFDVRSNTEMHTVSIPAQKGQQPTHAFCQAEIKIVPKQLNQQGNEYEIGRKDDEGFARALDFLKKRPEYKDTNPPPVKDEKED